MRLIDADALRFNKEIRRFIQLDRYTGAWPCILLADLCDDCKVPTIEAEPVKHGRWEKCGGDLHSSGYAIFCSVCNKVHFVHRKYSLGGLNCEELFKKPEYCPNCGAKMDGGAANAPD